MALYELNDEQVKNLRIIIADSNIKGAAARAVVQIEDSLSSPIKIIQPTPAPKAPVPIEPTEPPAPATPETIPETEQKAE